MMCRFCHKLCFLIPPDGWFGKEIQVWKCSNHPISTRHYLEIYHDDNHLISGQKLIESILYWKFNDQEYAAHYYNDECFEPFEIEKRGQLEFVFQTILQLPYIPEFTPENIQQKVNLYLPYL
jgi:hypothetical protein